MPTFIMLFISLRIFLMYTNFILSALLLYLSVRVVLPSLSRSYCLNLGVPAFFYTVCRVTQEQIYYYNKRPSTFETVVLYLGYFGQEFILYDYVYFSTLTIFLAYIAYAKPILFKKLATTRAMVLMAILGHSFALGSVLIVSPNYPLLVDLFKPTKSKVFAMVMAVQLVVLFIIYVAMVILYILAIIELRKNIALLGAASPIVLSHRKMLKSLLIYCTPPNVFAILAFPTCLLNTWREIRTVWHVDISSSQWSEIVLYLIQLLTEVQVICLSNEHCRVFVTLFTAFVAFGDYRMAIKNGVLWIAALVFKAFKILKPTSSEESSGHSLFKKTTKGSSK